jgi:hypothetical protein
LKKESFASLKEAILELYLSVKIRSDDEIDGYTEEQFKLEKQEMRQVDGFTLIDHIKSSIEILMNMKMEDNNEGESKIDKHFRGNRHHDEDEEEAEERRQRRKARKEAKR